MEETFGKDLNFLEGKEGSEVQPEIGLNTFPVRASSSTPEWVCKNVVSY